MRAKSLALLVLAMGCGLVAAIGITQVMAKKSGGPATPRGETVRVFVALEDIPFGELVTAQNVKLEDWPKDKVPEGFVTKLEELENRRTRTRLFAGDVVLDKKLFKEGDTDQGATALIPKGYRVVPVRVDAVTGGANLLLPGNRVDVLVNLRQNENVGIKETCTKTLLQDVRVFAVNDVVTTEREKGTNTTIAAKTISLLLTPEQTQRVALATQLGTLQLTLRSLDDEETPEVAEMSVRDLFGRSETANRDAESLVPPDPAEDESAKAAAEPGILAMLNQLRAQTDAQAATPVETEKLPSWQIRVIRGGEVDLERLELQAGDDQSRSGLWHCSTVTIDAVDAAPAAGPAVAPPSEADSETSPPAPSDQVKTPTKDKDDDQTDRRDVTSENGPAPAPARKN